MTLSHCTINTNWKRGDFKPGIGRESRASCTHRFLAGIQRVLFSMRVASIRLNPVGYQWILTE
jgi:hypothetical protein